MVTATGAWARARAALIPPKPAPTITTRGGCTIAGSSWWACDPSVPNPRVAHHQTDRGGAARETELMVDANRTFAVTPGDVKAAAVRIRDAVPPSPSARSSRLSAITGSDIVVKFENLQFTASFKERGACN